MCRYKRKTSFRIGIYICMTSLFNRWNLIAGRIPSRKAEEIERFWIMRHGDAFSVKRHRSKVQDS